MLSFELMKAEEHEACAELASKSFFDYVYFTDYVPDDKRRRRFLHTMLAIEVKINDGLARFFTAKEDGKIVAVAMLCDPDYRKPSDAEYIKAGFMKCYFQGGIRNVSAWNNMESAAGKPCHSLTGQVWYLNLLTVDPQRKGEGIGSRMLRECILPYVEERGGDKLCLFTNSQANRRFYQKNGFNEFDEQSFVYKGKKLGSWSYEYDLSRRNVDKQ